MGEQPARGAASSASESSPLIPPPSEIDIEAGAGDQFQCRICLETDGTRRSTPPFRPRGATLSCEGDLSALLARCVCVWVCAGRDFIAPCKCKGTSKYVHRDCLDHWRAVKV